MGLIEFIALGQCGREWATELPRPACANSSELYRALVAATMQIKAPYFCWLDDGDDDLLPGFTERMESFAERNVPIAYGDEYRGTEFVASGPWTMSAYLENPTMIHHGVVCRTADAQAIDWPNGCYWYEGVCYGALASKGYAYVPGAFYRWNKTENGAHNWGDTGRAVINSLRWLQGKDGVHLAHERI